ncbi:lytic transglycosylase domain-containing protein [Salmonella enterica subsp. enterica serovar Abony]|nr:transglycosylase SLT domain-containing protein [Salmonella enterica subsp. enterica serovar Tennessee]EFU5489117.1 lytic transglycosylase domain-containing protein [Salmonella enterica subsp. enterica serovar Abony]
MMTPTALLALAIQCSPTIHPDTTHDIARTESGLNPFAIAEIIPKKDRTPGDKGVISYFPRNKQDALNTVRLIEERKRRYSVGLMQITSTNFKKFNVSAESLFSPCINLSVFEKIITDCYLRGGSLKRALSCYYSGNFDTGQRAEKDFSGTSYTQRIGYVVPSTKVDKAQEQQPAKSSIKQVIWPHSVVRGNVSSTQEKLPDVKFPIQVIRGDFVITENKEINK